VLGPKALYAAEAFVVGLFQMYPTVYFHKTTRGAEKLVQTMLQRVFELAKEGNVDGTGLPACHPLIRLLDRPDDLTVLADLDDSVVLGALPLLRQSKDALVSDFSARLHSRQLFKAIDLYVPLSTGIADAAGRLDERKFLQRQEKVVEAVADWNSDSKLNGRILLDAAVRKPYKPIEEEGPINQIWIRGERRLVDLKDRSAAVAATGVFRAFRAYVADEDAEARRFVQESVSRITKEGNL
jgi:hypothetical protein